MKMGILETILGIVMLVLAVALIALVLLQQGKDKKLSGAIAGGSDTFYGKSKGADKDKKYSIATTLIAIVFVVIVVVMYLLV
jgi:preprotein translocase subunit SecG